MDKKNIIIAGILLIIITGSVIAWMVTRPEKPTLEEANAILAENIQNRIALTSFTSAGDMDFQIKDGEMVLLKVGVEDMRHSVINPFDFTNQDSSMTIKYNIMIGFETIIDRIKAGMTPEDLEALKEPILMMGMDFYGLMQTMRALGERNISAVMEMKSIDFNSYMKIVEIEGLREIITSVGGMFLAEMTMGKIEPYLGVWRKTPADPIMKKEMIAVSEKIEKFIPSIFNTHYVKEVLPNTKINGTPVYSFRIGIDLDKIKDAVISFIPLIVEKLEMEVDEKEEMKTGIINAWPEIVKMIEAAETDYKIYIDRETHFTIKETVAVNIDLAEFITVLAKMVPQEEITPEGMVEFKRFIETIRGINVIMTINFEHNDHNAVPAIVPPAEYEVVIPPINKARARARDARRLADVRQLAFILEKEVALYSDVALEGCTKANASTITCTGPREIGVLFPQIRDPGRYTAICSPTVTENCTYGISRSNGTAGARTNDYRICFHLEIGTANLSAGIHSVKTGFHFVEGCL